MTRASGERGSASIWVITCCALLLAVAFASTMRATAVVARHRAESAADLAALAGAGQIGVSRGVCQAAARVATANGAAVHRCAVALDPSGRSGTVAIQLSLSARLPVVGTRQVVASARAGRDAVAGPGPTSPAPVSAPAHVSAKVSAQASTRTAAASSAAEMGEDEIEQSHRALLVERVVAVAAFR
jgi:secretion/DNA translocation related TadE-like protein